MIILTAALLITASVYLLIKLGTCVSSGISNRSLETMIFILLSGMLCVAIIFFMSHMLGVAMGAR